MWPALSCKVCQAKETICGYHVSCQKSITPSICPRWWMISGKTNLHEGQGRSGQDRVTGKSEKQSNAHIPSWVLYNELEGLYCWEHRVHPPSGVSHWQENWNLLFRLVIGLLSEILTVPSSCVLCLLISVTQRMMCLAKARWLTDLWSSGQKSLNSVIQSIGSGPKLNNDYLREERHSSTHSYQIVIQ